MKYHQVPPSITKYQQVWSTTKYHQVSASITKYQQVWCLVPSRGAPTTGTITRLQDLSRCLAVARLTASLKMGELSFGWVYSVLTAMEYFTAHSEDRVNNFEMHFDDERPPIYNAEDYAVHLRKFTKMTGAQLYSSVKKNRSQSRSEKKNSKHRFVPTGYFHDAAGSTSCIYGAKLLYGQ